LLAGDYAEANRILLEQVNPAYLEAVGSVEMLTRAQAETAQKLADQGDAIYHDNLLWGLAILAIALGMGIGIAAAIMAAIGRPIAEILAVFRALANGDFSRNADVSRNDEMGRVLQGLQTMQMHQSFNLAEVHRVANDNLRVRIAFDCVNANLRIADMNGTCFTPTKDYSICCGGSNRICANSSQVSRLTISWAAISEFLC